MLFLFLDYLTVLRVRVIAAITKTIQEVDYQLQNPVLWDHKQTKFIKFLHISNFATNQSVI